MTEQTLEQKLVFGSIRGDVSAVQDAIAEGVDVNARTSPTGVGQDNTALMWASAEGHGDVVRLLLESGAQVNAINEASYTALMYGAEGAHYDVVSHLLDFHADIQVLNRYQETILMAIARAGFADLAQRLVSLGAEVNAVNWIGDTALYLAVEHSHSHVIRSLIACGGNVNTQNRGDWTPLMMAAARGDLESMELLLDHGADGDVQASWGSSVWQEAKKSCRSQGAIDLLRRYGITDVR